jgi:hypothetical protein
MTPGMELLAAIGGVELGNPGDDGGPWALGPVVLGPAGQAAAIVTRAHTGDEVRALVTGPPEAVAVLAAMAGRP